MTLLERVNQERARRGGVAQCLWPAPYNENTPEAAWRFILNLRTWNEAESEEQFFPDKEFLKRYVYRWHECLKSGRPLIMEKCRRMVISWCARALELHQMGLGRCDQILCGEDLEAAAKHVWRLKHLYTDLQKRMPDWKLPPHSELKYEGEKKLKSFTLANGSVCSYANGQSNSLQGDGVRIITMEELGIYRYPSSMIAQAKLITKGSAKHVGGFVNVITNASTNSQWQKIKSANKAVKQSPDIHGLEHWELPSGEMYLKLHHYADPEKDGPWLETVRLEMSNTPAEFRLQVLMDDKKVEGALWTRDMFEQDGFRVEPAFFMRGKELVFVPPKDVVKIVVAVDPSVSDPERAKNPNKEPDDCGLVVGGITENGHAYVLGDFTGIMSPDKWSKAAVLLFDTAKAASVIAEGNQGGELVRLAIQAISNRVPVQIVHASIGKRPRAEVVQILYSQGRVKHCGQMPYLEDQMVTWDSSNPSAKSPGAIDALVWLFHGLGLCNVTGLKVTQQIQSKRS